MEFDPNSAATGAGSVGGAIGLWYAIRKLLRLDKKEANVEDGWQGIVSGLKEEIERMRKDIDRLIKHVEECETERTILLRKIESFERRYGTRKEGGAE